MLLNHHPARLQVLNVANRIMASSCYNIEFLQSGLVVPNYPTIAIAGVLHLSAVQALLWLCIQVIPI